MHVGRDLGLDVCQTIHVLIDFERLDFSYFESITKFTDVLATMRRREHSWRTSSRFRSGCLGKNDSGSETR